MILVLLIGFTTVAAVVYLLASRDDHLVWPIAAALVAVLAAAAVPWHLLPRQAFGAVGVAIAAWIAWVTELTGGSASPLAPLWFIALAAVALSTPRAAGTALGLVVAAAAVAPLLSPGAATDDRVRLELLGGVLAGGAIVLPWTMERVRQLLAAARTGHGADERETSAEVQRVIDARHEYLSLVAHELRNPLLGIRAAARAVAKDVVGRQSEEMALGIATEAHAALELLDGLTDVASLESGRISIVLRPTDLAQLLAESVRRLHVEAHRVVLHGSDFPVRVMADDARIGQVIRNLVGNAAKYSPEGSEIEISLGVSPDRASAIVRVRDHGPGIPPAERERLFQKFARLSTAGATRGSGLGLYISRGIVNDHQGEMWADWPAGGGTVFSFGIPLIGEDAEGGLR